MKLLVATRSDHKMAEIREILSDVPGLEILDLAQAGIPPAPEEDHLEPYATFEENARSKARYFHARSGLPTVADDSGLAVDALGGEPGVLSRRFAPGTSTGYQRDLDNNRHLLDRLAGVPDAGRTARYVCLVALEEGHGDGPVFRGSVEGRITHDPRGAGGFGYDPLFFVPELGRTFGEATPAEKHALSHRGKAFRALAAALRTRAGGDEP
ncbi:MAG TPA: RdgB/HAM1 family non-canonical purine NTP pyrophosphatase [Longimicrobiales bacterium]|nr:RdgB/HAM1 family non-canonical purine NTP pyrophosphatase [Longimicrobiales bacterium]